MNRPSLEQCLKSDFSSATYVDMITSLCTTLHPLFVIQVFNFCSIYFNKTHILRLTHPTEKSKRHTTAAPYAFHVHLILKNQTRKNTTSLIFTNLAIYFINLRSFSLRRKFQHNPPNLIQGRMHMYEY